MSNYEIEVKYRTRMSQSIFEYYVSKFNEKQNIDYINRFNSDYKDTYYYDSKNPWYYIRYRKEPHTNKIATVTFKEEKEDITVRKEINLDTYTYQRDIADLARYFHNFHEIKAINKSSIVYMYGSFYLSWYEVNDKDRFIEIEIIEGCCKTSAKDKLDFLEELFFTDIQNLVEKEHRSLFNMYILGGV